MPGAQSHRYAARSFCEQYAGKVDNGVLAALAHWIGKRDLRIFTFRLAELHGNEVVDGVTPERT
ncbi:MAG TPA: hypothetical protein DCQ77_06305 [Betaproteobacteria bacterium]|nr:hypothetical protein [Betaproteobacteria bacterium]